MTSVISLVDWGGGGGSVRGMDQAAVTGAQLRVGAARRRTIIAFVLSVGFLTAIPVAVLPLDWPGGAYAAGLLVLLAAGLGLVCWRFWRYLREPALAVPGWFVAVAVLVGLALWCVGVASSVFGWAWATVPALLLGDIVAGRPKRQIVLWVAGASTLVLGSGLVINEALRPDAAHGIWLAPAIGAFYVASMWTCNLERFWLRSVVTLDEARRDAAELATARERLRLADDLHDILGHALEVVAFKCELAERLLPPGARGARAEIEEVQRVARTAMTDVRALAHSRRLTDLVAELAGAGAVLDSAGVALSVVGYPRVVAAPAQDVLGRVLREAMTNVLRHAEPTRCSITVDQDGAAASLLVVNDGVLASGDGDGDDRSGGSGLAGLARYLGERAGELQAGPGADGTFLLRASLPVPSGEAAV